MTMARVENNQVTLVGLPADERNSKLETLKRKGWVPVKGTEKPTDPVEPGYQWTYGEPWTVLDNHVVGSWSQTKRPQPYPSWSWVDGEGWVPPTAKPEGDYVWDEDSQSWVKEDDRI